MFRSSSSTTRRALPRQNSRVMPRSLQAMIAAFFLCMALVFVSTGVPPHLPLPFQYADAVTTTTWEHRVFTDPVALTLNASGDALVVNNCTFMRGIALTIVGDHRAVEQEGGDGPNNARNKTSIANVRVSLNDVRLLYSPTIDGNSSNSPALYCGYWRLLADGGTTVRDSAFAFTNVYVERSATVSPSSAAPCGLVVASAGGSAFVNNTFDFNGIRANTTGIAAGDLGLDYSAVLNFGADMFAVAFAAEKSSAAASPAAVPTVERFIRNKVTVTDLRTANFNGIRYSLGGAPATTDSPSLDVTADPNVTSVVEGNTFSHAAVDVYQSGYTAQGLWMGLLYTNFTANTVATDGLTVKMNVPDLLTIKGAPPTIKLSGISVRSLLPTTIVSRNSVYLSTNGLPIIAASSFTARNVYVKTMASTLVDPKLLDVAHDGPTRHYAPLRGGYVQRATISAVEYTLCNASYMSDVRIANRHVTIRGPTASVDSSLDSTCGVTVRTFDRTVAHNLTIINDDIVAVSNLAVTAVLLSFMSSRVPANATFVDNLMRDVHIANTNVFANATAGAASSFYFQNDAVTCTFFGIDMRGVFTLRVENVYAEAKRFQFWGVNLLLDNPSSFSNNYGYESKGTTSDPTSSSSSPSSTRFIIKNVTVRGDTGVITNFSKTASSKSVSTYLYGAFIKADASIHKGTFFDVSDIAVSGYAGAVAPVATDVVYPSPSVVLYDRGSATIDVVGFELETSMVDGLVCAIKNVAVDALDELRIDESSPFTLPPANWSRDATARATAVKLEAYRNVTNSVFLCDNVSATAVAASDWYYTAARGGEAYDPARNMLTLNPRATALNVDWDMNNVAIFNNTLTLRRAAVSAVAKTPRGPFPLPYTLPATTPWSSPEVVMFVMVEALGFVLQLGRTNTTSNRIAASDMVVDARNDGTYGTVVGALRDAFAADPNAMLDAGAYAGIFSHTINVQCGHDVNNSYAFDRISSTSTFSGVGGSGSSSSPPVTIPSGPLSLLSFGGPAIAPTIRIANVTVSQLLLLHDRMVKAYVSVVDSQIVAAGWNFARLEASFPVYPSALSFGCLGGSGGGFFTPEPAAMAPAVVGGGNNLVIIARNTIGTVRVDGYGGPSSFVGAVAFGQTALFGQCTPSIDSVGDGVTTTGYTFPDNAVSILNNTVTFEDVLTSADAGASGPIGPSSALSAAVVAGIYSMTNGLAFKGSLEVWGNNISDAVPLPVMVILGGEELDTKDPSNPQYVPSTGANTLNRIRIVGNAMGNKPMVADYSASVEEDGEGKKEEKSFASSASPLSFKQVVYGCNSPDANMPQLFVDLGFTEVKCVDDGASGAGGVNRCDESTIPASAGAESSTADRYSVAYLATHLLPTPFERLYVDSPRQNRVTTGRVQACVAPNAEPPAGPSGGGTTITVTPDNGGEVVRTTTAPQTLTATTTAQTPSKPTTTTAITPPPNPSSSSTIPPSGGPTSTTAGPPATTVPPTTLPGDNSSGDAANTDGDDDDDSTGLIVGIVVAVVAVVLIAGGAAFYFLKVKGGARRSVPYGDYLDGQNKASATNLSQMEENNNQQMMSAPMLEM